MHRPPSMALFGRAERGFDPGGIGDSPGQIRTAVARSLLGVFGRSRASYHWPATASRSRLAARPRGCNRDSTERAYIDFSYWTASLSRRRTLLRPEQDQVEVAEESASLDRETAFLGEHDHRLLDRLLVPRNGGGPGRIQSQRRTIVRVELRLDFARQGFEEL